MDMEENSLYGATFFPGHRVVTFNLVFSAASSFEDYADGLISLMDDLNLKSSFFLGHSMSAMVGCKAAIKRPELFHHLILLCGSPRYLNTTNYEGGFELSEIEEMLANMKKDFYSWTLAFAPAVLGTQDPKLYKEFQDSLLRMNPEDASPLLRTIFLTDNRDILQKVSVPSTIIQTQKDMVVPISVAQYLHENLGGGSSVVIIPVEGHTPQLTAPRLLTDALENALEHENNCSIQVAYLKCISIGESFNTLGLVVFLCRACSLSYYSEQFHLLAFHMQ